MNLDDLTKLLSLWMGPEIHEKFSLLLSTVLSEITRCLCFVMINKRKSNKKIVSLICKFGTYIFCFLREIG